MANYPNKPWSDNQETELFPGVKFRYNAAAGIWTRKKDVRTASDSDAFEQRYNTDKSTIESRITTLESQPVALDSDQIINIVSSMSFDFETF